MLDIRIPIGLMFAILGPVLILYGLFPPTEICDLHLLGIHVNLWWGSPAEIYEQHSLGVNVNLWWGFVLAAFGAFMLAMAYRASRKPGKQETP